MEADAKEHDIKVETIDTIISWLEKYCQDSTCLFAVCSNTYQILSRLRSLAIADGSYLDYFGEAFSRADVSFHRTGAENLARKSILVEAILNLGRCRQGKHAVDMMAVADYTGQTLIEAQRGLSALQNDGEIGYHLSGKVRGYWPWVLDLYSYCC